MKNLRAFFRTIKGKIIAISTGVTLAITLFTVTVCFFVFQSLLRRNLFQSMEYNLQVAAGNMAADVKELTDFIQWCQNNDDMLKYLDTFREEKPLSVASRDNKYLRTVALSSFDRLQEEYRNTRSSRYVTRVILSNPAGTNYLQIIPSFGDTPAYQVSHFMDTELFHRLYEGPSDSWAGLVSDPFYKKTQGTPILPIFRTVTTGYDNRELGWIYLSVSSDLIMHYLQSFPLPEDSSLFLTIGDHTYQIRNGQFFERGQDFQILSRENVKGVNQSTLIRRVRMDNGKEEALVTLPMDLNGWSIHQTLSRSQLTEQRNVYGTLLLFVCLVILSLGFFLIYILNRTINQPVTKIQEKIDRIALGDFSRDPSIEWDHELGDIGKGVNRLSQDVQTLIDRRIQDEKQKKDLEYQILQSQINPHFLYNTLNSIKWMATIQGASGIAEMTTALARLLKNVAKGSSAMIPLREELELIKDYFLIQKYRYGGSITISYDIPEELYDCLIHRFSLQPIIENALFHGIEPKGAAGRIQVTALLEEKEQEKLVSISITDNGVGMTPETIEKVLHQPAKNKADFFRQVGISNVNQRIRYDFGPAYGISITSQPGVYTTMTIRIPFRTIQEKE